MITEETLRKAEEFALAEIERHGLPARFNYDLSNQKGQEIVSKIGGDRKIVLLGTVLMDIKLGQAFHENRIKEHIPMGVEAARAFLDEHGLTEEEKKKVLNCIAAHHGTAPYQCIEAEICANADCYRFISPVTIFRNISQWMQREMTYEEALRFADEKLEEKRSILSLKPCKDELEPHYIAFKQLLNAARGG